MSISDFISLVCIFVVLICPLYFHDMVSIDYEDISTEWTSLEDTNIVVYFLTIVPVFLLRSIFSVCPFYSFYEVYGKSFAI